MSVEKDGIEYLSTESVLDPFEVTAEGLFALLWDSLADLLGTAATAALLRRAILRASAEEAALAGVTAGRNGMTYKYAVPETWQRTLDEESLAALQTLTRELCPFLLEMTGPLVVRRLARVEALRLTGLVPQIEVTE